MATLTLPPDYFRTAAEQFKKNPGNRAIWLKDQISKASSSLIQYQTELNQISAEIFRLGGEKGEAQTLVVAGSVLAAIPVGFTQVVGGLVIVGASFFSKYENKLKLKRVTELQAYGISRYNEAVNVAAYKTNYEHQLLYIKLIPILLVAVLIWLILK